jgi:hypothetical protein
MSRVPSTLAALLLGVNTAMTLFLTWHQITLAQEGRKYGLDEQPPVFFLLFAASLVAACGVAFATRKYRIAVVGGAALALFLAFICLLLLAGAGM